MSKNLTRKALALATGVALGVTSLTAAPAFAAAGDVAISPKTGTGFTVFNTDAFNLKTSVSNILPSNIEDGKLAYKISNPDQADLAFDLGAGLLADADTVTLTGYTANGTAVVVSAGLTIGDNGADTDLVDVGDKDGAFVVDFAANDITSLVISGIPAAATAKTTYLSIRAAAAAAGDSTAALTNAENAALATIGYGDGDVSISAQSWLDTNSDVSDVDASYASTTETIKFIDPSAVSVIAKVERVVGTGLEFGNGDDTLALATSMNSSGQDFLTGSLQFSATVNLDQVNLAKWKYAVDSSTDADDYSTAAIDQRASGEAWAVATHNFEVLTPAGYSSTNKTAFVPRCCDG
jgi:hypothetical protein